MASCQSGYAALAKIKPNPASAIRYHASQQLRWNRLPAKKIVNARYAFNIGRDHAH